MTTKQFVDSPAFKFGMYMLAIGIAWATLKADVARKADESKLQAKADRAEVQAVMESLQKIGTDIRIIRADQQTIRRIICASARRDSFCGGN